MKTVHKVILLSLSVAAGIAIAAQQTINIGTVANDGTGDTLRAAFDKANDNFTELYASTGGGGLLFTSGSTTPQIDNSAAETVIFTGTVPGGTLGTDGAIQVRLGCLVKNNVGTGQGYTIAIKYGGTTIYSDSTNATVIGTSSTPRPLSIEFVLFADAATSAQRLVGTIGPLAAAQAATTGYGDLAATPAHFTYTYGGTATVDSTVNQTLEVTITLTAANADFEWTTYKASAWSM